MTLPLLCFHHAGGSALTYRRLSMTESRFAVIPVPIPLQQHIAEPEDRVYVDRVVGALERQILRSSHTSQPYALYGHSMGAAVAHALTRRLEYQGRGPCFLALGACLPPHITAPRIDDAASEERLFAFLEKANGAPLTLRSSTLRRVLLPRLRAGLRFVRSWREFVDRNPLDTPVAAIAGSDDPWCTPSLITQWESYSTETFRSSTVIGSHLFHQDAPALLDVLDRCLPTDAIAGAAA